MIIWTKDELQKDPVSGRKHTKPNPPEGEGLNQKGEEGGRKKKCTYSRQTS